MEITITDLLQEENREVIERVVSEYTFRLVENTKDLGIFCVDEDEPVFSYEDRTKVIDSMLKDKTNLKEFEEIKEK